MSEITRETLMAYADRQLDPSLRAAVEAHVAGHPEAGMELGHFTRQTEAIRTLYGPAETQAVPSRLDPHRLALVAHRRRWQSLARVAMILVVLGIGVAAGWMLRPLGSTSELYNRLIADAVSAHTVYAAENRHAVEVASAESDHLSTWLSNRLATHLAMPDLSGQGLTFLGGRLLPAPEIAGGRAAQLMYEDNAGTRLTLYVTPATGISGPAYEAVSFGADTALYWSNATFTCTIVGPQPPDTLRAIARTVFSQLSPGKPALEYRDL